MVRRCEDVSAIDICHSLLASFSYVTPTRRQQKSQHFAENTPNFSRFSLPWQPFCCVLPLVTPTSTWPAQEGVTTVSFCCVLRCFLACNVDVCGGDHVVMFISGSGMCALCAEKHAQNHNVVPHHKTSLFSLISLHSILFRTKKIIIYPFNVSKKTYQCYP